MPTIWRQKSPHMLTDAQRKAKLAKDAEYEIAHLNLTADFNAGKLTQAEFEAAHAKHWQDYDDWAKANGLYEEVVSEQQLAEAEANLNTLVEQVNLIRAELKKPLVEFREI